MRSLVTRRAALVAGVATVGVIALAGCSAGQVAETALLDTPIAGVNAQAVDGSVFVRNAQVQYNGTEGYAKGENAPLELSLYNQTEAEVTVSITSEPAVNQPNVVSAQQVGFVTKPAPSATAAVPETSGKPSSSANPSAPATPAAEPSPVVTAAQIKISPLGEALFRPTDANKLQVIGLSDRLRPGQTVNLVFHFSNGAADLPLQVPVAIPLTPASRAPGLDAEHSEGE
ncbi:hypothetical protein BJY16_001238 [Actinoplanes octamycinicus]|uniref:Copper(I)-binding protein n=1 Tax=Actinoplanes octamycinicus TaxID=135948 RepID=A0A7W7M5I7_9ACTN|nr:hypothetical protein [Actinoplanes octamycinicus]MBB4737779.1 hypothetical protein [Actinoplanes octamycinicus]GIE58079.1 hypothetical protein Aoc01nite_34810 [Actinoplanes octamycinicus]